jgi:VIT1/CCC1 family predicted Fe2+/Mn2+ transporter
VVAVRLLERWRSEKTAAYLSRVVAEAESDPKRQALFRGMADAAEMQAAILAHGLGRTPGWRPPLRARLVAGLTRRLGPRAARPLLVASKVRGLSVYGARPPAAAAPAGHPLPTAVGEIGRRHRTAGGGALRAAVFGVNDGLVSNTALVMGIAGADAGPGAILLTGAAGLIAGAFSMAAGEYVSMQTQREMFEHQIAQEREELSLYPDEEAEELALIYHARGVDLEDARTIARQLVADPAVALDTLAREELGLNPDDLGRPLTAALTSFAAFAAGAALPLAPFLAGAGEQAVPVAAGLAAAALFAVGAVLSLFSGRNAFAGGLRMLALGGAAGAATYGIGAALGVAAG